MAIGHRAQDILVALTRSAAPPAFLAFHGEILRLQAAVEASVERPSMTLGEARDRIIRGVPLLTESTADELLCSPAFQDLVDRVARVLADHRPDLQESLREARESIAVRETGSPPRGASVDARESVLTDFLDMTAARGYLRPAAAVLAPLVEDRVWDRCDCPVCGAWPDLGVLNADDGGRTLLCSRCDAAWAYRRIGCPFCRTEAPDDVAYRVAGDGTYRLYVCERCGGYLKTVDGRRRAVECLPVERVLTVGLDAVAIQAGYGVMS